MEEVGAWLESLSLGEYRNNFISHEIRGAELLNLERRDLKVRVPGGDQVMSVVTFVVVQDL